VKRKNPQNILLLTVVGTLGIAGLQRFAVGEIALGFLYLFTFGFFWIGTVLDLINYKKIANDFNLKMAYESYQMIKMGV
jgi:TM2 domain-containing membrane protein YozV